MKTRTRLMALLTIVVLMTSCYRSGTFCRSTAPKAASPMTPSVAE